VDVTFCENGNEHSNLSKHWAKGVGEAQVLLVLVIAACDKTCFISIYRLSGFLLLGRILAWGSTYHLTLGAARGGEGQHRESSLPFGHRSELAGQHRTMCSYGSLVAVNKLSCRNIGIGTEDISAVVENVPGPWYTSSTAI
jgi:hypothetical protein